MHPYAVIGGEPQDLKFDAATPSGVRIGAGTTLREHVTVNRSTKAGGFTEVGAGCFLMAACHVAHDCVIGDQVVIANAVLLAGHVHIGGGAFLGGGALFHQFGRVGELAMVSGGARISEDLPPFVMAAERNDVIGLNLVGLKRRGFSRAAIVELKQAFHVVYETAGNIRAVAAEALTSGRFATEEAKRFLSFFTEGKRRLARARRGAGAGDQDDAG